MEAHSGLPMTTKRRDFCVEGTTQRRRSLFARFFRGLGIETYPMCPICGKVVYLKSMPFHLSLHKSTDPDVIAWRKARHE